MDLFPSLRHLIILVCLYACLLNNVALADDRQVIENSNDVSDNLPEKTTDITFDSFSSVISSINHSIVHRNTSILIAPDRNYLKNLQGSPLPGILNDDGSVAATGQDLTIVSDLVTVITPELPAVITQTLYSKPLSVLEGSYIQAIILDAFETSSTLPLAIFEVGLQDIAVIEFLPADGLSLHSCEISGLSIHAEATEVDIDITVAADAEKTVHRIVVFQTDKS